MKKTNEIHPIDFKKVIIDGVTMVIKVYPAGPKPKPQKVR